MQGLCVILAVPIISDGLISYWQNVVRIYCIRGHESD